MDTEAMLAAERQKLTDLERASVEVAARLSEARQRLVEARLDELPEAKQAPLIEKVQHLQIESSAADSAVTQHADMLEDLIAERERRVHQAAVAGLEAQMEAQRAEYREHYATYERAIGEPSEAHEAMVGLRSAEMGTASRLARLEGDTNPASFLGLVRIPNPGDMSRRSGGPDWQRLVDAYRPA